VQQSASATAPGIASAGPQGLHCDRIAGWAKSNRYH
jgi:hypothetical protein